MEKRFIGAITGDLVGSRFEHENIKTKEFVFFHDECTPTDDSIMTLAIADGIIKSKETGVDLKKSTIESMRMLGRRYCDFGFGRQFLNWIFSDNPEPYNSYGNGAAMRISSVPYLVHDYDELVTTVKMVTEVTHNHPEALKGAEAVALCIRMALDGFSMQNIRNFVKNYYDLNFTLDEIRESYIFHVSCQETVPQAIEAFLESTSFEDAIRNAISIGGDSDTLACIAGSIAGAYYGVSDKIALKTLWNLDETLLDIYIRFNEYVL